MTTDQQKLWEGKFGDLYQERNTPDEKEISNREKFLESVFMQIYSSYGIVPKSVLEVGAGQGPNLMALEKLSIHKSIPIKLYATEINQIARVKLSENTKTVDILDQIPAEPIADLVMTYGVLIHTHPAHVRNLQQKLFNASNKFILSCEYFAPEVRPLMYRGEKDALWLDDYGKRWLDNCSLRFVSYGFCWKLITGLDNVTFWLFEKKDKMI